jgi:hypothetical protein
MRLKVDGAWSLRTKELTDADGRHDCIVDARPTPGAGQSRQKESNFA